MNPSGETTYSSLINYGFLYGSSIITIINNIGETTYSITKLSIMGDFTFFYPVFNADLFLSLSDSPLKKKNASHEK